MALRVKTIEYAFPLDTAVVASATARNFTQITVYIPETTSRTFRSVHMECSAIDSNATAASHTAWLMGVALGAVAINTATVTLTAANSGENQGFLRTRDVTSYFVTNFTGTSMTCDARLTCTGGATINATCKLVITYEYDDAATTQIKTVRVPVDGNNNILTTSFANLGGVASQIPAWDTFLPEAGVVIRSYFFQMDNNTGTTAAATGTMDMRYDGATTVSDGSWAHSLNSATFYRRIDNLLGLSTSVAQTIEAKATSTTAMPVPCLCGVLYVTYEYQVTPITVLNGALDASQTSVVVVDGSGYPAVPFTVQVENEKMRVTGRTSNTLTVTRGYDGTTGASHSSALDVLPTILNSVAVTVVDEAGWQGGTTTADKGRFYRQFLIPEPGFIDLKQSGVFMALNDAGVVTTDLRIGSQASRTFTQPATLRCGGATQMRRIDAGESGGVAGVTLARGFNDLTVDYFTTSGAAGNIGSNASAIVFLNYTSGQSAHGVGDHSHTTIWMCRPWATGGLVQRLQSSNTLAADIIIPETDYWLMGVSYYLIYQTSGTAQTNLALNFSCEVQSGEAEGAGWRSLYSALYSSDNEMGVSLAFCRARTEFKRWANDPDTARLDVEVARDYRFDANVNSATIPQALTYLTHSSFGFDTVINVTGSAGGTVYVKVRWASDGTVIWSGTRAGDGTVTASCFEDTEAKFTEVWESDSLVGRSGNWY